jgi:uncharacterized protein Yka (UPF0111/DUF47 family)
MTIILEKSTEVIAIVVQKIRSLKDPNELFELCIQIHTLENEGDRVFEKALSKLFQSEVDPLHIIKWKEIYESLEKAIDKCEDISDVIWGIVVKYG